MFDDITFSEQGILNKVNVSDVDLGSLGRKNVFANHAFVFMNHLHHKVWKQLTAFYFTKGVKTA